MTKYPEGFPDFAGDVIYSEKYWEELVKFAESKGISLANDVYAEELDEHIQDRPEPIETEQELKGTDNAVVDCKVADVVTHCEDEKPVDCEGKKKPLEKPLTESNCQDCGGELTEARRTGEFVKLVNDKYRVGEPLTMYDLKSLMRECDLTVRQQGISKINFIAKFDNNCEIIQETDKAYLVSVPCYFRNPQDRSQILDTPRYIAVWVPKTRCVKLEPVTEETHAQFAKPEGNRVQAYNNALKYAKQYNKEFIYGYTNHTGKFFALDQPIKVTGTARDAEKEFRNKYKNCGVVYMVYPNKTFIKEEAELEN